MKIFYAPTLNLIKDAAAMGYTHVVVHSFGHVQRAAHGGITVGAADDIPLFFNFCRLIAEKRRKRSLVIAGIQEQIGRKIKLASRLGMKSIMAGYEISLPAEREGKEQFCLAKAEDRIFLENKIAELFATFPALAGYIFTAKEASAGTYYAHICRHCDGLSFAQRLNLLAGAVLAGKDRVNPRADAIFRIWGTHFPKYFYGNRTKLLWRWFRPKDAFAAKAQNNPMAYYDPDKVLPEFSRISNPSLIICSKATWQDHDFHQPLNPWIGSFRPHPEFVEVSLESLNTPLRKYFVYTAQLRNFMTLAARKRAAGVMVLPMAAGFTECWHEKQRRYVLAVSNGYRAVACPSIHDQALGNLSYDLVRAMLRASSRDLKNILAALIADRYGKAESDFLAGLLLSMEKLAARAINCRGISLLSPNHYLNNNSLQLENYKEHVSWTCCAFPGGSVRVMGMLRRLGRLYREKDAAVLAAQRQLARLRDKAPRLPKKTFWLFDECYSGFVDLLRLHVLSQKIALTLWAMEQGCVPATERALYFVLDCIREKEKLLLQSAIRQDVSACSADDRLYGFGGIQRYKNLRPGS